MVRTKSGDGRLNQDLGVVDGQEGVGCFYSAVFPNRDLANWIDGLASVLDWRWVKQGDLKRRIQRAADAQGKVWRLVRQGGRHEVWQCGATKVTLPPTPGDQRGHGGSHLQSG